MAALVSVSIVFHIPHRQSESVVFPWPACGQLMPFLLIFPLPFDVEPLPPCLPYNIELLSMSEIHRPATERSKHHDIRKNRTMGSLVTLMLAGQRIRRLSVDVTQTKTRGKHQGHGHRALPNISSRVTCCQLNSDSTTTHAGVGQRIWVRLSLTWPTLKKH